MFKINADKPKNKEVETELEFPEVEEKGIPKTEEVSPIKFGVVVNCLWVRVREEPKPDGKVLCEIDCLTQVMIDVKESTENFYKIFTDLGIEGFCVKDYIAIKK